MLRDLVVLNFFCTFARFFTKRTAHETINTGINDGADRCVESVGAGGV